MLGGNKELELVAVRDTEMERIAGAVFKRRADGKLFWFKLNSHNKLFKCFSMTEEDLELVKEDILAIKTPVEGKRVVLITHKYIPSDTNLVKYEDI